MTQIALETRKIKGINMIMNDRVNMSQRVRQNMQVHIAIPKHNQTTFGPNCIHTKTTTKT